jgi:hypothetical protein
MIFRIKIFRLDLFFLLHQGKRKKYLHQQKSPFLYEMGFILFNNKLLQLKSNYFLYFLTKNLSTIDKAKLTMAPMEANKTVLKISSECKFGSTLKNVPPAVANNVGLLDCICMVIDGCNLTYCR